MRQGGVVSTLCRMASSAAAKPDYGFDAPLMPLLLGGAASTLLAEGVRAFGCSGC